MVNKEFIVAGIKNLLHRNYGINPDTIDLDALVDSELEYGENWSIIKELIVNNTIDFRHFRCGVCEKKLRADWKFCPGCGGEL